VVGCGFGPARWLRALLRVFLRDRRPWLPPRLADLGDPLLILRRPDPRYGGPKAQQLGATRIIRQRTLGLVAKSPFRRYCETEAELSRTLGCPRNRLLPPHLPGKWIWVEWYC